MYKLFVVTNEPYQGETLTQLGNSNKSMSRLKAYAKRYRQAYIVSHNTGSVAWAKGFGKTQEAMGI